MSSKKLTWIIILTIITILMIIILLIVLIHNFNIKKRKKKLEKFSKNVTDEKIKKNDITLSRISSFLKTNSQFNEKYEELNKIFDELFWLNRKLKKEISTTFLNYKKIKNKNFKKKINEIDVLFKKYKNLEKIFDLESTIFTQQDSYIAIEKNFYNNNFRSAIEVYKDKRILLDKISNKIDQLIESITLIEKKLDESLIEADLEKTNHYLREYSKKVIHFCTIINSGPSLQNYIYNYIKISIKKLLEGYQDTKQKLNISFSNINFSKHIEVIHKHYQKLQTFFMQLHFEKAEQETKTILKLIKNLENEIEIEAKSHDIFLSNYKQTIDEVKNILLKYIEIRKKIKEITKRKLIVSDDFKDKWTEIKSFAKVLDIEAIKFKENIDLSTDTPYSVRLFNMKILLEKILSFVKLIDEIEEMIFDLDIDSIILRNKFKRAKSAFYKLIRDIQNNSIKISIEQQQKNEILIEQISKATFLLADKDSSNENKKYIEKVIKNIIQNYKLLAGNVEIINIIQNLIKKLSDKRAINNELHYQISLAEKEYLEGKYSSSLNTIIQYLEKE